MTDAFKNSAQFYDCLYSGKDYAGEAAMYSRALADTARLVDLSGATLLEVGCGTGNFCLEFEKLGWRVFGIDPSEEMVDIAVCKGVKAYTCDKARLHCRSIGLHAAIACPFAVLNYACVSRPLESVLADLRMYLHPGGAIAFDVTNYSAALCSMRPTEERAAVNRESVRIENPANPRIGMSIDRPQQVVRRIKKSFDPTSAIIRYAMQFEVQVGDDGRCVRWCETHQLRTFTPAEVEDAMLGAGFRNITIHTMHDPENYEITPEDWSFFAVGKLPAS